MNPTAGVDLLAVSFHQAVKIELLEIIPISRDAAHVYAGLFVYVVATYLFRSRALRLLPVVLIAGGVEMLDLLDDLRILGDPRWRASAHDLINTCLLPSILWALQWVPRPWQRVRRSSMLPVHDRSALGYGDPAHDGHAPGDGPGGGRG